MNQGYGCWGPPPPWTYPPPQNDRNDDPIRMARRWEKFLKQERKDFKKDEKKEEKKTGKTFSVLEMFIILMCVSPFVAPLQKILLDQLWTKLLPH